MTAEIHNLWKTYLYKLQIQAPKPKPIECVEDVNAPSHYGSEFHGAISRSEADALLKKSGEGSYLVRESQRLPGTFTLCLRYGGCNKNYKLFFDGKRHYVGEKRLSSLESLVADGLITMHVEAKARQYLENMAEQAIYENSPYITLRGKQRNLITSTDVKQVNTLKKLDNNDLPTTLAKTKVQNEDINGESTYKAKPRPGQGNRRFSVPALLEDSTITSKTSLAPNRVNRNRFSKCLTKIQHQASISLKPNLYRTNTNAIHPKSCLMTRKDYSPRASLFTPLSVSPNLSCRFVSQPSDGFGESSDARSDSANEPRHFVSAVGNGKADYLDSQEIPDSNVPQSMDNVTSRVVMRKKKGFQGSAFALNTSKSEPFSNLQSDATTCNMSRRSVRVFNGTSTIGSTISLSTNSFYPNPFGSLKFGNQYRPVLMPIPLTRPSQNPPLPPDKDISSTLELEKVRVSNNSALDVQQCPSQSDKTLSDGQNEFEEGSIESAKLKPHESPKNVASNIQEEKKSVKLPSTLRYSAIISSSTLVQCNKADGKKRGTILPRRPLIPFLASENLNAKNSLSQVVVSSEHTNGESKHSVELAPKPVQVESKSNSSESSSSLRSRTSNRNSPLSHTLNNTSDSGYQNEVPHYEKAHVFKVHTFKGMHWCDFCGNFMWGLVAQGVRCKDCGLAVHKRCSVRIPSDCCPEAHKSWLKCRVFGVDLSCHLGSLNLSEPLVLTICAKIIESSGIDSEGIYRVPGYAEDIETLRQYFDSGIISHGTECVQFKDINVVAGVLKLYFRLLPIPLITFDAYHHFLDALKMDTLDQQLEALKMASSLLPLPHYNTLSSLMAHLKRVSDHQRVNLMNASNLAMVFAPNLLRNLDSYSDQPGKMAVQESFSTIKFEGAVIEILIKFHHLIFQPTPPSQTK